MISSHRLMTAAGHLRELFPSPEMRDAKRLWELPDAKFFCKGACHILTYAFLETYQDQGFEPIWMKPAEGFTGNHVIAVRGNLAFDYLGYNDWDFLQDYTQRRAQRDWHPRWGFELVTLTQSALISQGACRSFVGLRLREPRQFYRDALPRARDYVARFPSPDAHSREHST